MKFADFRPVLLLAILFGCLDYGIDIGRFYIGPNLNSAPHKAFVITAAVYGAHWIDVKFNEENAVARSLIYGFTLLAAAIAL